MKWVYLINGTVHEVLPPEAVPVAEWYGDTFAAGCVEAPDELEQRWTYDEASGKFFPPESNPAPEPLAPLEDRVETLERKTAAISAAIERGMQL